MKTLSVILLSNTLDKDIYKINCSCIESLYNSEDWNTNDLSINVVLLESNKLSPYHYDDRVDVIIPNELFNFNRFLNIGIQKTNSIYVALCNNDILFRKAWFTEILKIKSSHPDILCFSPIDRDYWTMSFDKFPDSKDYYIGWENKYFFSAWCFVLDRSIFKFISPFDETFNFYSADDDFIMTLRKYALDNALVTHSHVKHLSQQVTRKIDKKFSPLILDKEKYPIPEKFLKRGFSYLWDDFRHYEAFFKMYNKWGDEKMIRRIDKLISIFPFLRIRLFTRIIYNKRTNLILSKLSGI